MARRSNQNSIPSSPSIPSSRSKSDGAGPGVRSTVMNGEQICVRAGWTRLHFLTLDCNRKYVQCGVGVSCMGEVSSFFVCDVRVSFFVRVALFELLV